MAKDRPSSHQQEEEQTNIEKVIKIDRVTKVVKGGKRLAFRAFVISGDQEWRVGFGLGKSKEVPIAIKKAVEKSSRSFKKVHLVNGTVPHAVEGRFASSRVIIKPAKPGTGVIAGGPVRILLEAAGLKDVVSKALGSRNAINITKAAMDALLKLRNLKEEEMKRGKKLPVFVHKTSQ